MAEEKKFSLPNRVIKVVPNIKATAFIPDTNHVAAFLAPRANKRYVVPYHSRSGQLKNILTNEEKELLEKELKIDLSIYKKPKEENFWLNYELILGKDTLFLHLDKPMDYIAWKLCLALEKDFAPSEAKVQDKASYSYYLVDIEEEVEEKAAKADIEEQAWMAYAELKKDRTKMIQVLSLYGKKVNPKTTSDSFLSTSISDIFKRSLSAMKDFVDTVNDPDFDYKVLIEKAVNEGALVRRKNNYFLPEGDKLAASTQQMVDYLRDTKNQDVYMLIEQRVKNAE